MPSIRSPRGRLSLLVLLALALGACLLRDLSKSFNSPQPEAAWRQCIRVVDADTIDLENGERLRLIGVDAPETRHPRRGREICGPEATAFVEQLALGRRVRLSYDWDRLDPFGRTLAYVYLEDGTMLNAEVIRQGYAHAYRKFRYRLKEDFLEYELEAHRERRGCLPLLAPNMPRE